VRFGGAGGPERLPSRLAPVLPSSGLGGTISSSKGTLFLFSSSAPGLSFGPCVCNPLFVLLCTSDMHLALAPVATAFAPVCLRVSPTLDNGGTGAATEGWATQPYRPPSYLHPGPSIAGACALVSEAVCVRPLVRVSMCG
jgi:hypothetical protein